ncbi:MAG: DUF2059 domain-containing protein [Candidatus Acidiferrales bacterium]
MKFSIAVMAAAIIVSVPAFAQAPANGTQAEPPAHHQPGVAAKPAPAAPPEQAAATAPPSAPQKIDPAEDAAIRHLMDITESSKLGDTIQGAISSQVESVMNRAIPPDQVQKFMDTFNQKFDASAPSSAVTDAMVPIYAQHFSMEEIQGITRFYESPVGQRLVKEMPTLVQETHNTGAQMDQKAAIDTLRAMSTDYPQLKQMLPPDPNQPAEAPAPTPSAAPAPASPSGSAPAPGTSPAPSPSPAPGPSPSPASPK